MIYLRTVGVTSVLAHCTVIHSVDSNHPYMQAFVVSTLGIHDSDIHRHYQKISN